MADCLGYQFLLLAMNPQTYMSFFGMDTDNTTATGKITEVMGGRRSKQRKTHRKQRKTPKNTHKKTHRK